MSQISAKPAAIPADKLRQWGSSIFQATGMAKNEADVCADVLVDSNLRGIDTHGIYLANLYARRLKIGLMNPKPQTQVREAAGRRRHPRRRFRPGSVDHL